MGKEFYASKTCAGQGVVVEQETGRDVALVYDIADTQFLAAAPVMLKALETALQAHDYDGALTLGTARLSPAIRDMIIRAIDSAKVCQHDHRPDGTQSGGCVGLVCTWCGDRDERDVS